MIKKLLPKKRLPLKKYTECRLKKVESDSTAVTKLSKPVHESECTGKIIAKTDAADWALDNNLCPDPGALRIALEVRRSPLNHKEDKQTFDYAETLAEPIQRFADVLEKELTAAKEA